MNVTEKNRLVEALFWAQEADSAAKQSLSYLTYAEGCAAKAVQLMKALLGGG